MQLDKQTEKDIQITFHNIIEKTCFIDKLSIVLTLILAFVFLHEDFTWKAALGSALITAGTLVMVL